VNHALPGKDDDNPLYVIDLEESLEIPSSRVLASGRMQPEIYQQGVIKSRWRGVDVGVNSEVSVYVLLPPQGAIEEGRGRLVKLPISAWASCSLLA
jgi:hypothetical protein